MTSATSVLTSLCSGLGYDDLEIQDGDTVSTSLEALLLDTDAYSDANRRALRNALLRYCEQDTLAMVRLYEQLAAMAAAPAARHSRGPMNPLERDLDPFVRGVIDAHQTTMRTDGFRGYWRLGSAGVRHERLVRGADPSPAGGAAASTRRGFSQ